MRRLAPLTQAWRGIVLAFLALGLAALLNAHGLRKTAVTQPDGPRRDLALGVTDQLVRISDAFYLDLPRRGLKTALGRASDDRIDTTLALPPVPTTRPKAKENETPVARQTPHHPVPPRPAFSPERPLRVWVAGDSLVEVPGRSIERAVVHGGPVEVVGVESRVATGLGRPDVYNWYTRFREAIRDLRPHVAILSFGSNDGHDYLSGVPEGVTIGSLGSRTWIREYRRRVEGVTREFNASGAYVVWVGLPKTRGEGRNRGFRVVNSVLRAVAASNPRTSTYVDTWRMFTNRHRSYVDYVRDKQGRLVRMRAADGVHYAPAAGDVLARHVFLQLNERYDLTS